MAIKKNNNKTKLILDKLLKNLSCVDILQNYESGIEDFEEIKKSPDFIEKLSLMINDKDYTAIKTLELFWNKYKLIDIFTNKEQVLKKIYHFCQFLSFPDTRPEFKEISPEIEKHFIMFLLTYRQIFALRQQQVQMSNLSRNSLTFLNQREIRELEQPEEYTRFVNAFDEFFVYEMMALSKEIYQYTTLEHVCGVHTLALSIARQMKQQGFSVDLGIVSGSAAGHDIGKYGCRGNEQKRVPYLHYYYTDIWFQRLNISYIGHIAVNHSVWDLELENLPVEAMILIYSDFRVKNAADSNEMKIYSLQESFQVILNKLDNLDEKKEQRYRRVFAKLKDFEDFLIEKKINTDFIKLPEKKFTQIRKQLLFPLLQGDEVIEQIKYLSLEQSFQLMFQLRNESSINSILETARSESYWQNLQEYLMIFSEYASYLNQNEKILTLKFLYELLVFPEESIRRRSAKLIGYLIATFDEEYRKEMPDDVSIETPKITSKDLLDKYIQLIIEPTHKTSELNQSRVRENLPFLFDALFKQSKKRQKIDYIQIIKKYYQKYNNGDMSESILIYLIQGINNIPVLKDDRIDSVFADFLIRFIQDSRTLLRIMALDVVDDVLNRVNNNSSFKKRFRMLLSKIKDCSLIPAENHLRYIIIKKINAKKDIIDYFAANCVRDIERIDKMYLDNLKSSTDAIIKKVQIDMLTDRAISSREETIYTALHFCNILKVSSHEPIRNYAGRALIKIIPYLNVEQKNDISIELLKALEIDDYQYTKYIPYYLGQSIPYLPPREIDEFIDDLEKKIKIADQWTCTLLIRTLAVAISRYAAYLGRYQEKQNIFEKRLARMLGILMNGLAHHDPLVKRITSRVIGKEIIATDHLSLKDKATILRFIAKKLVNLITPASQQDMLLFFANTVSLHRLYIFISDYYFYEGKIKINIPKSIAFFPGSFDPFSLSHKEIVREIEKMGMEVYLSVDEFSWSKRTQPHLYRKNLINMSIADELNVYLYPENLPSNIANPDDLKILKKQFPQSEVYIVAGSDVLLNASAYNDLDNQNSVIYFPHIVFNRKSFQLNRTQQEKYNNIIKGISSKVIQLDLHAPFEEISSSQIRKNIDNHRDISDLVDPLAERFIYQYGLYQREPQYKSTLQNVYIKVEIVERISDNLINELVQSILPEYIRDSSVGMLKEFTRKLNPRIILLKDTQDNEKILGFSAIHWIRSSLFFHEFRDNNISQYIRDNATGRTIAIDGVFVVPNDKNSSRIRNLNQAILTETLAFCVKKDYDYAVFKNIIPDKNSSELVETLKLFGFSEIPVNNDTEPIMVVDIRKPCTISLDIETLIKGPFNQSPYVIDAIQQARKNLQNAMTSLYPGHLLMPFNIDIINQFIVSKICRENGVPCQHSNTKELGPLMCVPFGKILHKMVVPNTVTKSLHTDKIFTSNMQHFKIDSFGYYMSLENQVKMIRSFKKPVLLIDDLLHKGYRFRALSPLLRKENIKVHKIIVGLISGRGKELAMIQKRSVEGAYFIPNLRVWFNESDLYPFIGGDGLFRQESEQGNLVRSVNMILPYAYPVFLKGVDHKTIYNLSKTCIENAIMLMKTLEKEYQAIYHRKLTLGNLGEVCLYPRYPDHGESMKYNLSMATSLYLENDLELLHRIWEGGTKISSKNLLLYPNSREFNLKKEIL